MYLNKTVCKACKDKFVMSWFSADEKLWSEQKLVWCPYKYTLGRVVSHTIKKIPSYCPYSLEQVVLKK